MKTRFFFVICLALILLGATTAWANDQIVSDVTVPSDQPQADIVKNGGPPGTIQLWYTYTGTAFPCGQFGQFNLALTDVAGTNGATPTYPQTVHLVQDGNGPVSFSPVSPENTAADISVSGPGWTGGSTVTVSIDCTKLAAPSDGQDIVGNLNAKTDPGAHLDTKTTVQVHITLVFPTSCVKLYSFEANQSTGLIVSSVDVNAKKSGAITSTNPGQLSVDGLVVNLCAPSFQFDMQVGLGSWWGTNPTGNPGNATFLYSHLGTVDPSTYSLAAFGTGMKQGQTLCIENLTLDPGYSLLMTVHSALTATVTSQLTNPFPFSATIYPAGTACRGTPLLGPDPNPATSTLPYNLK